MGWMLTDEQMDKAYILGSYDGDKFGHSAIAKAQARKIVEWLYTQCPDNKHRSHRERSRLRLDCLETMEQLRKEVKEGE